ncbi:MAG: hypothetical protein ACRD1Z_21535 [Vicinamibacteria bacterium]
MAGEKILPHGPIEEFSTDIAIVTGDWSFSTFGRRMTIIGLRPKGGLLVYSPMRLEAGEMARLDARGEVSVVVVPNGFHRRDAAWYRERYPRARFLGPADFRKRIEERVQLDGTIEEGWPAGVENVAPVTFSGLRKTEVVLAVRNVDQTGTLIVTDLMFHMLRGSRYDGIVMRLMVAVGSLRTTLTGRLIFVGDMAEFRRSVGEIARNHRIERIIMAHGEPIREDAVRILAASGYF